MNMALTRIATLLVLLTTWTSIIFAQGNETPSQDPSERNRTILKLISRQQYQQAADECKALIESRPDYSNPYTKLVTIAARTGRLDQTQEYFEKLSETNSRAFYSLGLIHRERKEYQAAFDHQIKCLNVLPGFLPAVAALVETALALGKPGDAETFFRSRPSEAAFALGLGRLFALQGKYDSALELMEQALRLNPQLIEVKMDKFILYIGIGRTTEALSICEELLRVTSEAENPERRHRLLDRKTGLSYELGQTIMDLTEALRLSREYGLKISEADYLSRIATTYRRMNYFSKALDHYQRALAISRAGDRRNLSRYLGNIGVVYSELGNLPKAAESYRQAIDAARAASPPDKPSLINFLVNLSEISSEIGQAEQARILLEEAAQLFGSSRELSLTYRIQAGWATYYEHIRDFNESLKFNQAALQAAREYKDLIKEGACYYRIGDSYLSLKQPQAAIAAYQQALDLGRRIQSPSIVWKAEVGLARSRQEHHPEQALIHFRRAIEAIETIRDRQDTPEEKTGVFQNKTEVYQDAILLLTSMHRRDPSKRYDAEAFHLVERARARALLDSLGETAARLTPDLDKDLLNHQQEIQQRLSRVEAQMLKATGDNASQPDTLLKLEAELLQAVNDYADWRQQVRSRNHPRMADLALPEPFTLEQVQESLRSGGQY